MTKPQRVAAGQIHLRAADGGDLEYCAALYLHGMDAAIQELKLDRDLQRAKFHQQWAADEASIIIREGVAVGWLQMRIEGNSVFLAQLFVEPACQRRGIGTHILKRIIDEAAGAGRDVTLGVVRTNPALRLYERLGFRITHADARKFYMRREAGTGPSSD